MIVCVTGPMAAGKNAACEILEELGFVSIDADITVHQAVENSKDLICHSFGKIAQQKNISLLNSDGTVNRRNVGSIIFEDPKLVQTQENIVYPEVTRILKEFIDYHTKLGKNVVINATVLYKVDLIKQMDKVIFIDAPVLQRFFRAKKRDGMKPKQILQRFSNQKHLFTKYKKSNADIVRVWNTGNFQQLQKKIQKLVSGF